MRRAAALLLVLAILLGAASAGDAQGWRLDVMGAVVDSRNRPIEGLEVYLVHPELGRSRPRVTNQYGVYEFAGVPAPARGPFVLEVYWGQALMYRNVVAVPGRQPTIVLR